ncbi:MAG TPA: lipopolysaccharide heptosyltransferase II [Candidatus Binataceae bacterium]|nr:lipopolysaccharide heptosyltransferase II [Candidatus Binataceae bacterium]
MTNSTPLPDARVSPPRVLVKEVNWLGDLIISLPALRALRRRFPASHLAVLIREELAGFFDGCEWIDEIIGYQRGGGMRSVANQVRIVSAIRSHRFDLAILFPNSFSSALWVALAGVPQRAGYATDARGPLLTSRATPDAAASDGHQVNYWLEMVRKTVGAQGDPADCALTAAPTRRERMAAMLATRRTQPAARLIAIAPAAAFGPAKEWPPEQYASLIDLLTLRCHAECVLVGTPAERERCNRIVSLSRSSAIVTAGETGVGDLIALLSLCDGFVGNDSGPMHLAGALAIPTVAIFGSTNPARTGPLGPRVQVIYQPPPCSPCLDRACRFGHYECLKRITPETVIAALAAHGLAA